MKKLAILLIFSIIPAMSFSGDYECRKDKPFIDLWDTICPDDWIPYPSNTETRGGFFAPRSWVQIPKDIDDTLRPDQKELVVFWVMEYDEEGLIEDLFDEQKVKAVWENYYAECNKNRFRINDFHAFSDIKATNRIHRETIKSYDDYWLPIVFKETRYTKMNPLVLSMCNFEN